MGIVGYSEYAVILSHMVKINTAKDREELISRLPEKYQEGAHSIGGGLMLARKVIVLKFDMHHHTHSHTYV